MEAAASVDAVLLGDVVLLSAFLTDSLGRGRSFLIGAAASFLSPSATQEAIKNAKISNGATLMFAFLKGVE